MTREEFDEILEQTNAVICNREWYERLIKAFEQETCEDTISRQAVLNLFNKSDDYNWEMSLLKRKIENLPPVTPQLICEEREKGECPWYAG